jgi:hypothetical protein
MRGKKKRKNLKLPFKVAVERTQDIANGYQSGLKGLGTHSSKVELSDYTLCNGSVNIDSNVALKYPNANRWDYAFSYKSEVFFVEVHSAYTGEVKTVLKKLQWLKHWLIQHAPHLNSLKAKSKGPYFWIQSNGFHLEKQVKPELIQFLN